MDPLFIKATPTSLEVSLDSNTGMLSFTGRSVSEHSVEFFKPVVDWLTKYAANPCEKTECTFTLEYFNSAAKKSLVEIFRQLFSIHKKGMSIVICWNYEEGDDGMKELGEEYANMFSMKFKIAAH